MPESMTPVEIMRRAHNSEIERWGPRYDNKSNTWNVTRLGDDGVREIVRSRLGGYDAKELKEQLADEAGWRAALRALAEMEPTEEMRKIGSPYKMLDAGARAWILTAAMEGE